MVKNDIPLSVRGLCKRYPSFELRDVSFDLAPGKITGFIGRNGAGKTTTLHSILCFVKPDEGEVAFGGLTMADSAAQIKQHIGFVSAGMSYYTAKRLRTITAVTRSFYPAWSDEAYRRYMGLFGLEEEKTPAQLSNGMKIKYALALALSHGAELLLLDEPTSGLDPISREELIEIFLALREEGKTILFSTHITSDLEKCADRILFLQKGRLTADRELNDFAASYSLLSCQGDAPGEIKPFSLGQRRTKDGCTVLVEKKAADAFSLPFRQPTLDEIMVHLEKEDRP